MEQLIEYLKDYKVMNITKSVSIGNIKSYIDGLVKNDKVIMYFERNDDTEKIFIRLMMISKDYNYYILYKNKFIIVKIDDNFDEKLKIKIDELLKKD